MLDKFEAGTLNIPGIYGLNTGLKYILNEGVESIQEKEAYLLNIFLEGLLNTNNIRIIGKKSTSNRAGVVSLDFPRGTVKFSLNLFKFPPYKLTILVVLLLYGYPGQVHLLPGFHH